MRIYDRHLAKAALASPPATPIEVNTQFAALHKLLLGKLEKVDGQQFKGINVAVSNLAKRFASQDKGTVRLLRGLHEAHALERHLTEVGTEGFVALVDKATACFMPLAGKEGQGMGKNSTVDVSMDVALPKRKPLQQEEEGSR